MTQVAEFKNREVSFLQANCKIADGSNPEMGYQITNSNNYDKLIKILKLENKPYNSYVTISTYNRIPRFPLNPKERWGQWKKWVDIRTEQAVTTDFILDFDGKPTIEGLKKTWEEVQLALDLLKDIIGEQAKYLVNGLYFSGNKGFHVLGKCSKTLTPKENIKIMENIAKKLKYVCPSIDLSIYQVDRLRKLLGSRVYSVNFGKTRVVPIANDIEFKELLTALETKNEQWFLEKPLTRLGGINLELLKEQNNKSNGDD
jgi:hypothetical protein